MSHKAMPDKPVTESHRQVRRAQEDPGYRAMAAHRCGHARRRRRSVVIPLIFVFVEAFKGGLSAYMTNLVHDRDTWHSIGLTLTVVPVAVGLNLVFGVAAAWLIARFRFPGRALLTSLIDLPVLGVSRSWRLMFVLIFGLQGYLGPWLREDGLRAMLYLVTRRSGRC